MLSTKCSQKNSTKINQLSMAFFQYGQIHTTICGKYNRTIVIKFTQPLLFTLKIYNLFDSTISNILGIMLM